MAFTVELRKPTAEDSEGILGFYKHYDNAAKVLDTWSKSQAPTAAQVDSLITCITFFVIPEQQAEVRRQLLETASIADVVRLVKALPELVKQ